MKKLPKKSKPPKTVFVIIMQHNATADKKVEVAKKWSDALAIAGKYWESYDGFFDPNESKEPFQMNLDDLAHDPYYCPLEVHMKNGKSLSLIHCDGEGPCIEIQRAKYS
jgi:hypothetical protein